MQLCIIQVLNDQNTLIVHSILQNMVKIIRDTLLSSSSSTLNSLLLLGTESIINAHDPMQNADQIRIFIEPGQTHLTKIKHDPVDLDNLVDLTWFQPWYNVFVSLEWSSWIPEIMLHVSFENPLLATCS